MTEAEWLACTDPVELLIAIHFAAHNPRKFALFGCAAGHQIWDSLDEMSRNAIEVAERIESVLEDSEEDWEKVLRDLQRREAGHFCLLALQRLGNHPPASNLAREIFGNPSRPVTADPAWLTSTVVSLATGIYHDRSFDRLPILADALEDAGCDSAEVLSHLRSGGPHVRGCWALDLVLGKS